jgi:hypothetical protein
MIIGSPNLSLEVSKTILLVNWFSFLNRFGTNKLGYLDLKKAIFREATQKVVGVFVSYMSLS